MAGQAKVTINLADEHPVFLTKLKNTLQLILGDESQDISTTFHKLSKVSRNRFILPANDLMQVLRGCLISQRYRKAVTMLDIILNKSHQDKDVVIFKASFQILENLVDEANGDIVDYFVRQSTVLQYINKRELILEYLIYRIRHGNFEIPRDVIQVKLARRMNLRTHVWIDPLLRAYITLLDFVVWVNEVQCNSDKAEKGDSEHLGEKGDSEHLGEKIVSTISDIINVPGIWDIFVEKVVQILQYQNKHDDCTRILKNYVKMNPEHLHAYVYLEQHLQNQMVSDTIQREECLENIANISPSDPLVLDYVDILLEGKKIIAALTQLFYFMDYAVNKYNYFGWMKLFELSWKVYQGNNDIDLKELESLWTERENYWPQYHYDLDVIIIDSKQDAKQCIHKCGFLCIVLKTESHEYIQVVSQRLKEILPKQFRRLKKLLLKIGLTF